MNLKKIQNQRSTGSQHDWFQENSKLYRMLLRRPSENRECERHFTKIFQWRKLFRWRLNDVIMWSRWMREPLYKSTVGLSEAASEASSYQLIVVTSVSENFILQYEVTDKPVAKVWSFVWMTVGIRRNYRAANFINIQLLNDFILNLLI